MTRATGKPPGAKEDIHFMRHFSIRLQALPVQSKDYPKKHQEDSRQGVFLVFLWIITMLFPAYDFISKYS
ncbi:hypothetical protein D5F53_03590 [Paenibacillus lautus]|uniref:Uncharacterized protein n=1 Tax=Paenibacillus lautus TaxID=1401 RepID=A0A385TFF4_PAELA|nr:hypothetical protein D5F53_03590 [Paenibacillus lautus]